MNRSNSSSIFPRFAPLSTFVPLAVLLLAPTTRALADPMPIEADLVIRGGRVFDGTGNDPVGGDVAIRGEKIVAVGKFEVAGNPKIIDASGACVAPGFIDLHSHSDQAITQQATRGNVNFLRQGCTTIVTGNCGAGVVDVEQYFRTIEREGAGTNVAHLMPQGAVRSSVMGTVARPPNADELEKMRQRIDKGMRDGAFGMTTGLIYVPGTFSSTDEIVSLAEVVAKHGGIYASHIRDEGAGVIDSIEEAIAIGERAGCPVHISHLKASGQKAWGLGNDICLLIENARAQGKRVTADQYPYSASSTSLEAMVVPTWAREGGDSKLKERLEDPAVSDKLLSAIQSELDDRGGGSRIQIAAYRPKPDWIGKNVAQIARETNKTPLLICIEIIRAGGAGAIHFGMSDEDVRMIAARPFVATASDGTSFTVSTNKPHPRSYGTFPRKIGEFAHRRGYLNIPQAIRSASGLPADILGLKDRGYLRPGYVADVVVFKLDALKDHATFDDPHQYATGFVRVLVSGKDAVVDDKITGTLAGKPIRHEE